MTYIVVQVKMCLCLRCDHKWRPRGKEVRICPRCKSPYWDRPSKADASKKQEKPK